MYKTLLLLCALVITGCTHVPVYRPPIQQGNIITPDMLAKVHTGMTKAQVEDTLGSPVLTNTFDPSRVLYTYTYQPYGFTAKHRKMEMKQITLIFRRDKLAKIEQ